LNHIFSFNSSVVPKGVVLSCWRTLLKRTHRRSELLLQSINSLWQISLSMAVTHIGQISVQP